MAFIWSIAKRLTLAWWRNTWWSGIATGVICFVIALLFQRVFHWSTLIALIVGGLLCLPVGIALRLWQDRIEEQIAVRRVNKHLGQDVYFRYQGQLYHLTYDLTDKDYE